MKKPDAPRPFGVEYVPSKKRVNPTGPRRGGPPRGEPPRGGPPRGEPLFLCKGSEIQSGRAKQIHLQNVTVAVFNIDGKFYAIKDACPHADYPLYRGTLNGTIVQCANHNWQFDLRDGRCHKGDLEVVVRTFRVEVRGDELWLHL